MESIKITTDVDSIIQEYQKRLGSIRSLQRALAKLSAIMEAQVTVLEQHQRLDGILMHSGVSETLDELTKALDDATRGHRLIPRTSQGTSFRKPKVQVYAEILQDKGPIHVTEIAHEAEQRGVRFTGAKPPSEQVRLSLYGSKRFHNFGNNVWGLVGQEPPIRHNGHNHGQPQLIRVGQL